MPIANEGNFFPRPTGEGAQRAGEGLLFKQL